MMDMSTEKRRNCLSCLILHCFLMPDFLNFTGTVIGGSRKHGKEFTEIRKFGSPE